MARENRATARKPQVRNKLIFSKPLTRSNPAYPNARNPDARGRGGTVEERSSSCEKECPRGVERIFDGLPSARKTAHIVHRCRLAQCVLMRFKTHRDRWKQVEHDQRCFHQPSNHATRATTSKKNQRKVWWHGQFGLRVVSYCARI